MGWFGARERRSSGKRRKGGVGRAVQGIRLSVRVNESRRSSEMGYGGLGEGGVVVEGGGGGGGAGGEKKKKTGRDTS